MINGTPTLSFQFMESENEKVEKVNLIIVIWWWYLGGCKKLRFRSDSDGISCVRNVMEVSDKVAAVSDTAQTFTSVQSWVSKTILWCGFYQYAAPKWVIANKAQTFVESRKLRTIRGCGYHLKYMYMRQLKWIILNSSSAGKSSRLLNNWTWSPTQMSSWVANLSTWYWPVLKTGNAI